MPKPQLDANSRAHLEWLGYVQSHGLVVSVPALKEIGAVLPRNDVRRQQRLADCVDETAEGPRIRDFEEFARSALEWSFHPKFYVRTADLQEVPTSLLTDASAFGEVLRPEYAVRHRDSPEDGRPEWQLLVRVVPPNQQFDRHERGKGTLDDTAHERLERMLRETGVEAGMLWNGRAVRLVSAPRGESSGWVDFRVADMLETAGRPIAAALHLLLSEARLLRGARQSRLPALLAKSRQYQADVSERLAEQVLHALYELVRGLQSAHDRSGGRLLAEPLQRDPDEVYRALLTVILRMVFLLYAEQRDLLPQDDAFAKHYALGGLFTRLEEDAAQHPMTMGDRFGAWAQLVVLFRMVHDGARAGRLRLPARKGDLFDPKRYRFLERAPAAAGNGPEGRSTVPLVPDGTVLGMLRNLLVVDGERISYRALDVEQIGSVYETMMGFRMEVATGQSVSIKAPQRNGAPSTIDLEALVSVAPGRRRKWIRDRTDRLVTAKVNAEVRSAETVEGLHAALWSVLDRKATPDKVAAGSMVLQPGRERRASGSHYTPRTLTEPIVRKTLGPVLRGLRAAGPPSPESILEVKVCDPAMGSGAFLVEVCRQLADSLLESWHAQGGAPEGVGKEDEIVVARRMVAQRCLYGVDRNPMAVDLAKMSLWLATLAKQLPLTFLDHCLRHGDSLLGLTRQQIEEFRWHGKLKNLTIGFEAIRIRDKLARVAALRAKIQGRSPTALDMESAELWDAAREELKGLRLVADLLIAAHFGARGNKKAAEKQRGEYAQLVLSEDELEALPNPLDEHRRSERPLASFHWEIEFPEVFDRHRPGFDAIVGNPPFAGKNPLIAGNQPGYLNWLRTLHSGSHGNADLAAHFFRRAFDLIRPNSALGLVATNTIAQGDTRSTGLRWICNHGGTIYDATRRLRWPGQAAVVVSVGHVAKESDDRRMDTPLSGRRGCVLDGREVDAISAFLVPGAMHDDPARLRANDGLSFQGSIILGMGFTFDDTDRKGVATSLAELERLLEADPSNREAVQPYLGGAELNSSPTHSPHRWVINFRDYPLQRDPSLAPGWEQVLAEAEALGSELGLSGLVSGGRFAASCRGLLNWLQACRARAAEVNGPRSQAADGYRGLIATVQGWVLRGRVPSDYPHPVAADWPDLLAIVRAKVRPERRKKKARDMREVWWQFGRTRPALYSAVRGLDRVLAISRVGQHAAIAFLPVDYVFAESLVLFPLDSYAAFCALQSRVHEVWARRFGSSMKDDLRYTPSDCFETFPFPEGWTGLPVLETTGREYYELRAAVMRRSDEGLTKTYNRFHSYYEDDPDIHRLRELHDRMDRAVLDAYGWTDFAVECDFQSDGAHDDDEFRSRKKDRYRWSDSVQEEVLGRLIELNADREPQEADER